MASSPSKGKSGSKSRAGSKNRGGASAVPKAAASRVPAPLPAPTVGMTGVDKIVWVCLHLLVFIVPVAMSNFNWLAQLTGSQNLGLPLTYDQFDIVKVFVMRAFALGGLAAWSFQFFFKGGKLRRTKLDWLIVGFLAWVLLTSFTSISPATAIFGKYRRFEGFLSFLTYAVVYFLVVQIVDRPSRIRSLARTLMYSGLVVAGYGLLQHFGLDPVRWGANLPFETNRSFSTFGNPDLLGGFLIFPLVIAPAMALSERVAGWRIFYWVTFVVTVLTWIFAFVRGAWLGGALGLAILTVAIILARPKFGVIDWSFLGVSFGSGLLYATYNTLTSTNSVMNVGQRLASIFKFGEGSSLTRFEIWQAAWGAIKARPLTGFGADTFRLVFPKYKPLAYVKDAGYLSVADNVHDYPLQLMAGIGIIGFLLLYGFFGWALWLALPNAFSRGKGADRLVVAGFWAAAVGYIMNLMTGLSVTGSTVFLWIALAIIVSPTATEREHAPAAWGPIVGAIMLVVLALGSVGNVVFIVADNYFLRGQFPAADENPIALTQTAIALNPYNDIYRSMLGKAYENQMLSWLKQAGTDSAAGTDATQDNKQALDAFASAERTFKETIAIVPTEYDNYLFLSSLYNEAGSYLAPKYFADAIKVADAGIAVEPFGPGVRLQKAVAQASSGDQAGALVTIEAAVNMDPNYQDIHLFYAQALTQANRLKDAAAQYRILMVLDPANTAYSDGLKAVESSMTASGISTSTP